MKIINEKIQQQNGRNSLTDIRFTDDKKLKPIVIFCHGFKGFKNWGHFDLIADTFANAGFVFVKFNFSMNGTTEENPTDFADLEAFGNNNFETELNDLGTVIDFIEQHADQYYGNATEIYLIGHSRGGGITILKTAEDKRIKKLATWASVKDVSDFFINQDLAKWKSDGLIYTLNGRTQQNMPLYYQIYENYIANKNRLDIPKTTANIDVPWLIAHGTNDTSVPVSFAEILSRKNKKSDLFLIENADHTFGGKHPFTENELPLHTKILVDKCIDFFNLQIVNA
ncbi:MAG TPA: prolyl oligopeptidase family serine peptidase [Chitinophagales bacterium]|nr:prolyl oligopeptidase family serine peptidase [Chitinophagales bacterium]